MKKFKEFISELFIYISWAKGPPTVGIGWIILFFLVVILIIYSGSKAIWGS